MNLPNSLTAVLDGQRVVLSGQKHSWSHRDLMIELVQQESGLWVEIQCQHSGLESVTLHWRQKTAEDLRVLNDHWERTCGDVSWHAPSESEQLPWYFMTYDGKRATGVGVRTGPAAFCFWRIGTDELSLTLDARSGGGPVRLGSRKLRAAEIVTLMGEPGESPFQTGRRFMKAMCPKARMPVEPVYGINDWYFAYGNTSAELILEHTRHMAPLAEGLANRPFSVIDAGWFVTSPLASEDSSWGDRLDLPNSKFGDMARVAERIREIGMRPGIWTRPLCASHEDPASMILPLIEGRKPENPVLDPTIPENLERIAALLRLYRDWGYDLVKFDFTAFDLLGKWGLEMRRDGTVTHPGWRMHDQSRTNAEIVLDLYKSIRNAAPESYIISCDTFSHLSAGIFELNRIGDDTSGLEWKRTRKMGVNTMAFRGMQHEIFYAADPDCVGLTTRVPWEKNRQWMNLVAASGLPLFISAQPEAIGPEQRSAIREGFRLASGALPLAEPLDWMEHPVPSKWKLNGTVVDFEWD